MWAVLLALLLVSCYVDSSGSRQLRYSCSLRSARVHHRASLPGIHFACTLRRQEEAADDGCSTLFGDFRGVTVIMTADQNVALRGMLQDSYVPPPGQALCAALAGGQLLGSPVLLVATGPGDLPSGICSTFLLQACSNRIKDIISLGAADTSPQRGGVLNSGETQCLEPNADTQASQQRLQMGAMLQTWHSWPPCACAPVPLTQTLVRCHLSCAGPCAIRGYLCGFAGRVNQLPQRHLATAVWVGARQLPCGPDATASGSSSVRGMLLLQLRPRLTGVG